MSSAADPLAPLREAFQWTYFLDRARTGYVCLILYDIILCFPREKSSGNYDGLQGKRYIFSVVTLHWYTWWGYAWFFKTLSTVPQDSEAFVNLQYWASIPVYIPFQLLVGVRTYALYHGSKIVKWVISVLFVAYILIAIGLGVLFTKKVYFAEPIPGMTNVPCPLQISGSPTVTLVTLFLAGATYDAILWTLLAVKIFQAFIRGQTKLIGIIFKLGLLYFAFVTVMYIVCAVMFITWTSSKILIATAVCHSLQAVGSCLSCRFMLELREYVDDLTVRSMSVAPEHVMRHDELRFGGRIATQTVDSYDDTSMFTSSPSTPSVPLA